MAYQEIKLYQVGTFVAGNRLLDPEQRTVQARMGRSNSITSGHRACQGCGEALGARYVLDAAMRATDGNMVAVNATGCLEVFSTPYPESSWQLPWLHSLFGNAPAVAAGVAAALQGQGPRRHPGGRPGRRRRHRRHRLRAPVGHVRAQRRRAVRLLRQRGLHEHRRAALRRDPAGARGPRTPRRSGPEPGNAFGQGKNVPLIAMAHEIPYVATATVADLHDLEHKVERAMTFRGARYLHVLCPARSAGAPPPPTRSSSPGWPRRPASSRSSRPSAARSPRCRRSAGRCRSRSTSGSRSATPTCSATRARPDIVARLQASADRNIARFGLLADASRARRHRDGQAVRDHPGRRLEPGQQDRLLAHRAGGLRRTGCRRATTPARPARTSRPGCTTPRRAAPATSAPGGTIMADNPFPAVMGRVCYHPCETACNRGAARRGRRHQLRRALPRRRGDPAGLDGRGRGPADRPAACWSSAPGPSGLSAAYHLARRGHAVTIKEAGPRPAG